MSTIYTDEINNLVDLQVDDHYEGSGINDKTLGKMYYLKKYEKACAELYDKLRAEIEVPSDLVERKVIKNDKYFSVQAQLRAGSTKLDRTMICADLIILLQKIDALSEQDISNVKSMMEADRIINRCSITNRDSTVISIIEDKRDV